MKKKDINLLILHHITEMLKTYKDYKLSDS